MWRPNRRTEGKRTNEDRAATAEAALSASLEHRGDNPLYVTSEEGIVDLLADLMHLCDREGLDVTSTLASASINWEAER